MTMYKPPFPFRGRTAAVALFALIAAVFAAPVLQAPASQSAIAPAADTGLQPPVAEPRPHLIKAPHGHARMDPYYWLRDRESDEVLSYLHSENEYADAVMAHTEALQEQLFQEFRGRTVETDTSVPYRQGSYWYYSRHEEGREHSVYARRKGSMDAPEEIILDANERAEGKPYYYAQWQVSSGEDILAIAEDTVGRNLVTIRFRDLRTGQMLDDVITGASWSMAWAEDNRTIFFTARDPVTLRTDRVYRHLLGSDTADAELVWDEKDETFSASVYKTRSKAYIVVWSSHTLTDEFRFIPADRPGDPLRLFLPREAGHEHYVDHAGDHFYIRTNDGALDFRLARTPVGHTGTEHWEEVIPGRDRVLIHGFELFRDHLAVLERSEGRLRVRVLPRIGGEDHTVDFEEEAYRVSFDENHEYESGLVRLSYESLATPSSTYDYNMDSRELTLLKREDVLGGFDPGHYRTERLNAPARDGAMVPVTLVYRRDLRADRPQPLLLYAYGSYGSSMDPWFSSERLSLLDRGVIYAIAHVRGGQELGRAWYDDGRLLSKMNSFTDFIDTALYLADEGYTTPGRLFAEGISAGGLLVGAAITMEPDLFHGAICRVPFVDVVTTMLDESIPLTTFEYDEWGNPGDPMYYSYMLSYSPYDNVTDQDYPHMLVTSGLHDSQVQFWEPTKWVARMRATDTGGNRLLLRTNMDAGHGGAAGRYSHWREIAFEFAFLLDLSGLGEVAPRTD